MESERLKRKEEENLKQFKKFDLNEANSNFFLKVVSKL
jgi:hypothetical protein